MSSQSPLHRTPCMAVPMLVAPATATAPMTLLALATPAAPTIEAVPATPASPTTPTALAPATPAAPTTMAMPETPGMSSQSLGSLEIAPCTVAAALESSVDFTLALCKHVFIQVVDESWTLNEAGGVAMSFRLVVLPVKRVPVVCFQCCVRSAQISCAGRGR